MYGEVQVLWFVHTEDAEDIHWLNQTLLPSEPQYYKAATSGRFLLVSRLSQEILDTLSYMPQQMSCVLMLHCNIHVLMLHCHILPVQHLTCSNVCKVWHPAWMLSSLVTVLAQTKCWHISQTCCHFMRPASSVHLVLYCYFMW